MDNSKKLFYAVVYLCERFGKIGRDPIHSTSVISLYTWLCYISRYRYLSGGSTHGVQIRMFPVEGPSDHSMANVEINLKSFSGIRIESKICVCV